MFGSAKSKVKNQFVNERSQWQMLITEDGRLVDVLLPVSTQAGSCEDKDALKSWLLDSRNTVADYIMEPRHPKFLQVATERDVAPIVLWEDLGRKFSQTELDKIAFHATESAIFHAENKNDTRMMWWIILTALGVLSFMLLMRVCMVNYQQYFGGG